jgi:hypothetical protein
MIVAWNENDECDDEDVTLHLGTSLRRKPSAP